MNKDTYFYFEIDEYQIKNFLFSKKREKRKIYRYLSYFPHSKAFLERFAVSF